MLKQNISKTLKLKLLTKTNNYEKGNENKQ